MRLDGFKTWLVSELQTCLDPHLVNRGSTAPALSLPIILVNMQHLSDMHIYQMTVNNIFLRLHACTHALHLSNMCIHLLANRV